MFLFLKGMGAIELAPGEDYGFEVTFCVSQLLSVTAEEYIAAVHLYRPAILRSIVNQVHLFKAEAKLNLLMELSLKPRNSQCGLHFGPSPS